VVLVISYASVWEGIGFEGVAAPFVGVPHQIDQPVKNVYADAAVRRRTAAGDSSCRCVMRLCHLMMMMMMMMMMMVIVHEVIVLADGGDQAVEGIGAVVKQRIRRVHRERRFAELHEPGLDVVGG